MLVGEEIHLQGNLTTLRISIAGENDMVWVQSIYFLSTEKNFTFRSVQGNGGLQIRHYTDFATRERSTQ